MSDFAFEHNFGEVAAFYGRAADAMPGSIERWLGGAALEIAHVGTDIIKRHTPYGPPHEDNWLNNNPNQPDEHLRDTTQTAVATQPTSAEIIWRQTKTVEMKGGDQYPLWALITDGREGGYSVYAQNKQALFWWGIRDNHPVDYASPGPTLPDPYVADSMLDMVPVIRDALGYAGSAAIHEALTGALE